MPKKNGRIFSLDQKLKIPLLELSIKWQLFRRLIECIIETFDQVESLKKFDQVKMKLSIKWKMTILIKWNSRQGVVWLKISWSKLCFFCWSKVLIMNLYKFDQLIKLIKTFQLIESFINVILNFWSSAKICKLFFGSWSKVLIMVV